ncbi:MAG: alpha/beta hydrolase [Gemmatimonadota bacterium]
MTAQPEVRVPGSRLLKAMQVALFFSACVWFLFSLLAVFPAPFYLGWKLAIVATERGYYVVPAGLLFLAGWNRGPLLKAAAVLGISSSLLLLSPLARAARFDGFNARALLSGGSAGHADVKRFFFSIGTDSLPIDYYAAASAGRTPPLVVVIHGGSWRGGNQTELAAMNFRLTEKGYAVAAISYRFAPTHPYPAQLDDVRSAITLLRQRARELGFDPNSIVLFGRSAGGHLALLAAYEQPDPTIKGVVSFYGPTDLIWGYDHPSAPLVHDSRGILEDFIGGPPSDRPTVYQHGSPLTHIANAPPTLLIHGTRDELVNVRHSRRLADALRIAGKPVTFIELPWATHACDYFRTGPCGQISAFYVFEFLEGVLN